MAGTASSSRRSGQHSRRQAQRAQQAQQRTRSMSSSQSFASCSARAYLRHRPCWRVAMACRAAGETGARALAWPYHLRCATPCLSQARCRCGVAAHTAPRPRCRLQARTHGSAPARRTPMMRSHDRTPLRPRCKASKGVPTWLQRGQKSIRTWARGMSRRKGRICSSKSDRCSSVVMAVTLCCTGGGAGGRGQGAGREGG